MRVLRSFLVLLLLAGCVDPFMPEIDSGTTDLLVVDGFIDISGTATVKVSHSVNLDQVGGPIAETGANVMIKTSANETFPLSETGPGTYSASSLQVDYTTEYSVYIKTSGGSEYQSDNVKIIPTPDIDRIYNQVASNGEFIEIATDSHDKDPNSTGYYLLDAVETYQYHSQVYSKYIMKNGVPVERTEDEQSSDCWLTTTTLPVVANVNKLSDKVISGQVVSRIEHFSRKLSTKYSALVRQRSISREEFNYRDQIAKTTEQTGSMFGVIPGAVVGNIHTANGSNEYVLGWFGGRETKTKRYFMYTSELPSYFQEQKFILCDEQISCPVGVIPTGPNQCTEIPQIPASMSITSVYRVPPIVGMVVTVSYVSAECGDCRTFGGVNKQPLFWDDDH